MTDHDTQDVTECDDCPYSEWEYVDCHHPAHGATGRTLYDKQFTEPFPVWCPLRTRPVLVRLVAKESK